MTPLERRGASYVGYAPSSPAASRVGRGNRGRSTRPELALRRALWKRGLRYRVNVGALVGKPDVVFAAARVVVFCDGDFWHGRNWRTRRASLQAGSNATYWVRKISRNMARDRVQTQELRALGWFVIRVWETDIHMDIDRVAQKIERVVRARRNNA